MPPSRHRLMLLWPTESISSSSLYYTLSFKPVYKDTFLLSNILNFTRASGADKSTHRQLMIEISVRKVARTYFHILRIHAGVTMGVWD